jgi:hypothetical protein
MRKFGEVALNSKRALNLHKEISTDPKRGGWGEADENYSFMRLKNLQIPIDQLLCQEINMN